MRTNHLRAWLVASALIFSGSAAFCAVPTAEDLTGCKLPNGRAVLPALGTQLAQGGTLYKFSTQAIGTLPAMEDNKPLSPEQSMGKVQAGNLGDLQFMPDAKGNGTLWAMSGQIMDLPQAIMLSDVSGKKLDEPLALPKTSRNFAGQIGDAMEGNIYLVKTTDAHYALVRVLEMTRDALVVQFVYQPDGSKKFDIPANRPVPYARPAGAVAATQAAETPATATSPVVPPGSTLASVAPGPTGVVDPNFSSAGGGGGLDVNTPPTAATRTTIPPAPSTPLGPGDINDPTARVIRIVSSAGAQTPGISATPRPVGMVSPGTVMTTPSPAIGGPMDPALDNLVQQRTQAIQRRLEIMAAPAKSAAEIERKSQAMMELGYLHADDPAVADALVNDIA
ncbi:MAG TPA: hypothetical protein VHM90_00285, partial [Phycisphaerae bacterium]|nr:hypothetical protein [Phycisphaerae bacterium]